MSDMYKRIDKLLEEHGITGSQMSRDLGMSRSFMTELRKGRAKSITIETAQKIAVYFDVPLEYILGDDYQDCKKAPAESGKRSVSDDDIKFALFGGDGEITDEMYDEVKRFAAYIKQREGDKK